MLIARYRQPSVVRRGFETVPEALAFPTRFLIVQLFSKVLGLRFWKEHQE